MACYVSVVLFVCLMWQCSAAHRVAAFSKKTEETAKAAGDVLGRRDAMDLRVFAESINRQNTTMSFLSSKNGILSDVVLQCRARAASAERKSKNLLSIISQQSDVAAVQAHEADDILTAMRGTAQHNLDDAARDNIRLQLQMAEAASNAAHAAKETAQTAKNNAKAKQRQTQSAADAAQAAQNIADAETFAEAAEAAAEAAETDLHLSKQALQAAVKAVQQARHAKNRLTRFSQKPTKNAVAAASAATAHTVLRSTLAVWLVAAMLLPLT